jgi:GNAT superfamily N-acetyltransferase
VVRDEHVLRDGTKVTLRPIRPADGEGLRAAFAKLSPESRYRRFFAGVPELSDAMVRYLTEVDGENHVAIVAVVDSLDLKTEEGLGVARFIRLSPGADVAEVAVTVLDHAQKKGLGRLLLTALVARAHELGIKTFRAEVLMDNEPMAKLLVEAGAVMRETEEGTLIFDVPVEKMAASDEELPLLERFLRAAASSLYILLRALRPPNSDPGRHPERSEGSPSK